MMVAFFNNKSIFKKITKNPPLPLINFEVLLCLVFFKNKFIYFIYYLFLAVLGLRCCARAFSSCGERGLLFVAVHGLLIAVASLVMEHRL